MGVILLAIVCCFLGTGGAAALLEPQAPPAPPIPNKLPGRTCSRSSVQQGRIIAGVDAKKGAWPWIASLTITRSSGPFHFCGGSLIHPQWILTAAHCVDFINTTNSAVFSKYKVGLGIHNRSDSESSAQYIGMKSIFMHPKWLVQQTDEDWHDVALIHLKRPAILGPRVQTVCLPKKGKKPRRNSKCYLAGWGTTKHPGNSPAVLQQAFLPVVSESHCFNVTHMICAGFGKSSLTNACRGDSGGPLMCRNRDQSWTIHGVASFVVEYCKYYTGFADVGLYLDWIAQYVKF